MNLPTVEENSPSGEAGDMSLLFDLDAGSRAFVMDPDGLLDFSDGSWTLEAWVSTELMSLERMVLFYYGRPGEGYSLSINEDGTLQVTTLGIATCLPQTPLFRTTWNGPMWPSPM